MDKTLFQNYTKSERRAMLNDNADAIEPIGYMQSFSSEDMIAMKDTLSTISININDIKEAKAQSMEGFKLSLKPLNIEKDNLISSIKNKSTYVSEDCFKMVDHEAGRVGYYNSKGFLIEERAIRQDEKQRRFFNVEVSPNNNEDENSNKKTGTNN